MFAFAVLLGLAALYGAAGLSRPLAAAKVTTSSSGELAVRSALLGCPAPGSGGSTGGGIAVASAPGATGSGAGQVTVTSASPRAGGALAARPRQGQLTIVGVKKAPPLPSRQAKLPALAGGLAPTAVGRGGLDVTASGTAAQGIDVEQLGPDGRPTARCLAPGSDFWFVSPATPKLHVELYLLNVDSVAADAAVGVQTDAGPLLGTPDTGIAVPPHGLVVQDLDKLVHSARAVALHVTTSTGRVVAAVRETTNSAQPGIWLPAATQPATSQVLPGMPTAPGTRVLYLAVPGASAAQVKVMAVTPRGSYQPTGGNGISVLQHQATGIPIPSLDGIPGAIKITSNVPVVATLELSGGPAGAPGAFLGGAGPVIEQGVVAASPVGSAGASELVLAAPKRAATVRITTALPGVALSGPAGGGPTAGASVQVVHIAAKSATQVRIGRPKGPGSARATLVAIVVTPQAGSGPVYAARVGVAASAVLTALPVVSSPTVIRLPDVRESLLTVLGSQLFAGYASPGRSGSMDRGSSPSRRANSSITTSSTSSLSSSSPSARASSGLR